METSTDKLTPTRLSQAAGISVPYASQLLKGVKAGKPCKPSPAMAIRIYRTTGHKFSPIATLTDPEIDVLEKAVA